MCRESRKIFVLLLKLMVPLCQEFVTEIDTGEEVVLVEDTLHPTWTNQLLASRILTCTLTAGKLYLKYITRNG